MMMPTLCAMTPRVEPRSWFGRRSVSRKARLSQLKSSWVLGFHSARCQASSLPGHGPERQAVGPAFIM
jgi:hypothetical protein